MKIMEIRSRCLNLVLTVITLVSGLEAWPHLQKDCLLDNFADGFEDHGKFIEKLNARSEQFKTEYDELKEDCEKCIHHAKTLWMIKYCMLIYTEDLFYGRHQKEFMKDLCEEFLEEDEKIFDLSAENLERFCSAFEARVKFDITVCNTKATADNEEVAILISTEYEHFSTSIQSGFNDLDNHKSKMRNIQYKLEKSNIFSKMIFYIKRFFSRCKARISPKI